MWGSRIFQERKKARQLKKNSRDTDRVSVVYNIKSQLKRPIWVRHRPSVSRAPGRTEGFRNFTYVILSYVPRILVGPIHGDQSIANLQKRCGKRSSRIFVSLVFRQMPRKTTSNTKDFLTPSSPREAEKQKERDIERERERETDS